MKGSMKKHPMGSTRVRKQNLKQIALVQPKRQRNYRVVIRAGVVLTIGVFMCAMALFVPETPPCHSHHPSPASRPAVLGPVSWNVPMRDAMILKANGWYPYSGGSFPVILLRTPYQIDGTTVENTANSWFSKGYSGNGRFRGNRQ